MVRKTRQFIEMLGQIQRTMVWVVQIVSFALSAFLAFLLRFELRMP